MVIASEAGGLYASNLDGTCIAKLSSDRASALHMADDLVFYRNGFDMDRWYAIRLSTRHRFAVCGETMTDGGNPFHCTEPTGEHSGSERLRARHIHPCSRGNPPFQGTVNIEGSNPLFVDLREETPEFFTYHGTYSDPQDIDLLVTITSRVEPSRTIH